MKMIKGKVITGCRQDSFCDHCQRYDFLHEKESFEGCPNIQELPDFDGKVLTEKEIREIEHRPTKLGLDVTFEAYARAIEAAVLKKVVEGI